MSNQTLISVPTNFKDFKQLRAFVIKLIEQLDIVLGYRGNSGYEVSGSSEAATQLTLTQLNELVNEINSELDSLVQITTTASSDLSAVEDSVLALQASVATLTAGTAITDLSYTAPTISASYNQAEVQGVADDLETTSDKLDTLMGLLRTAGIIS